jgi:CcmD family protein
VSDLAWLFVALMAVWVGIGAYLLSLGLRQRKIERRIRELEAERESNAH